MSGYYASDCPQWACPHVSVYERRDGAVCDLCAPCNCEPKTIIIAADLRDADSEMLVRGETRGTAIAVTPRSPHRARGYIGSRLVVTRSAALSPSLEALLDHVRPCFATMSADVLDAAFREIRDCLESDS